MAEHRTALPRTAQTFAADAGDFAALRAAIDDACTQLGHAEVLIYNAVALTFGPPTMLDPEAVTADLRVGVPARSPPHSPCFPP